MFNIGVYKDELLDTPTKNLQYPWLFCGEYETSKLVRWMEDEIVILHGYKPHFWSP